MTGKQRRQQLLDVARSLFAEKGFEATAVEEIAQRAGVTKPVVYEHFGGKEGLYAVVVDREVSNLLDRISQGLESRHPLGKLEQAADAFLGYIEEEPEGFRVLVRDAPGGPGGTLRSIIADVAAQVEYIFEDEFRDRGYDPKLAPLYSHALVGMVELVGRWWLEAGKPSRQVVAAHLVNLAWRGLGRLQPNPKHKGRARKPS
ncbi:MAG TPA: TetR/AcrR family transcriptional regulator [Actinomycetota bacterium]|nr:TetR/AcrR family transcriptional regulator [Actinomycetota bacterium]